MTNHIKLTLSVVLLAGLSACGGDDSGNKTVDAGQTVHPVDSSVPDSGNPNTTNNDGGGNNNTTSDAGTGDAAVTTGDCFSGTPAQMADFLNRCTNAQTTTKDLAVPATLLNADGTVKAL